MPFRMQSTRMPQLTGAYASAVPGLAQLGIAQQSNERERIRAAIQDFGAGQARKRAERRGGEGDWASGAGAGAASGASIGTKIMPGWGTLIGAGVGAIVGGVAGHNTPAGKGGLAGEGGGGMGALLTDLGPIIASVIGGFKGEPEGDDWDQMPGPGGMGEGRRTTGGVGRPPGATGVDPFASWAPGAVTGGGGGVNPFGLSGMMGHP